MSRADNNTSINGILFILTGAICFSTKAIFVKFTYQYNIDAITSLTLRMLFAIPFYIFFFIQSFSKEKTKIISIKEWYTVVLMGIVGYYLASIFDFAGLQYISASLERLIVFLYPTLVVLMSAIFLKKKVTMNLLGALIVSYAGIAVVFIGDTSLSHNHTWLGICLVFMSSFTYAIYLIGTGELVQKLGTVFYTSLAMIISSILVFIHFSLFHRWQYFFSMSANLYVYGALMGIVATVIPSFLISQGIKILGSSKASVVSSIGPISTIILAVILLKEEFTMMHAAGTFLVLAGVWMISKN